MIGDERVVWFCDRLKRNITRAGRDISSPTLALNLLPSGLIIGKLQQFTISPAIKVILRGRRLDIFSFENIACVSCDKSASNVGTQGSS